MNTKTLALAMAIIPAALFAADKESSELQPIIVEATRIDQTEAETPAAVQVITREEIARSGAKDVSEVLSKKTTSLNLIGTGAGNPALKQVSMRGWGENGFGRTLILVNGERLNYADMSAPLLSQIDLGSVERIEILQGSQNVLHGDGASAGMINIVTEPSSYENHGSLSVHAGSWGTVGANGSIRGGLAEEGLKYWANGGWERSDGYRDHNGWDLYNLNGGIKKEFDNGAFLKLSAFYNDSEYDLPGYSGEDWKNAPEKTSSPYDWYRRETWGLNSTLNGVINEENRIKIDLSFAHSLMHSKSYYSGSYTDYDPNNYWAETPVDWTDDYRMMYDLYSYEITPQWINESTICDFDNDFLIGLSYRYDRLHGRNTDDIIYTPDFWGMTDLSRTRYEYLRQTFAFFAQDTFHLTESLAIQLGARHERAWNENSKLVKDRRTTDADAFDGAIVYTPIEDLKTFVRASRFYRNPFLDENPYKNYKAQSLLKPERGWSVDMGSEYAYEEFSLFGDIFFSRTTDEILYDKFFEGTNINSPSNVNRSGFTVGGAWQRDKVASLDLSYTYVIAEFDGGEFDDHDVPMTADSTIALNARVWLWDETSVIGGYRFLSERYAYSDFYNRANRLPSYGIFHLGAIYEPEFNCLKGFSFSFIIDNLFDEKYADAATLGTNGNEVYYPGAGRSIMFKVSYAF